MTRKRKVRKMAELKPCPFCGRIPKVEDCGTNRFFVKCKCGIAQDKLYFQRCDAIRRWNTRKTGKIDKDINVSSKDTIYRADAIDAFYNFSSDGDFVEKCESVIRGIPSAEPKTGEWVWSKDNASWCCGTCGCVFEEIDWKPEYNFCPNCGADMRKPMTIPKEIIDGVLGYDD